MASLNARKKLAVMNHSIASAEADGQFINVTKAEVTVRDEPDHEYAGAELVITGDLEAQAGIPLRAHLDGNADA